MPYNYLEKTDEKFAIQLANFASKLGTYAATFALTPSEIAVIQADAGQFAWAITNFRQIETFKKNWTSFKNNLKRGETKVTEQNLPPLPVLENPPTSFSPGVLIRFTTMVNRIKAHSSYTTAIGQNLGIEKTTAAKGNFNDIKPKLKAILKGGKVNLVWKKGVFTGIVIEKDSGAGFVMLDKDFSPDFVDNTILPTQGKSAIWQYRASYLMGDERVGLMSDIASITVAG